MKDYGPLLTHFDEIAKKNNLSTQKSAVTKMRELDQLKEDFNRDLNEKDDDSINELIQRFKVIELLEMKETLREEYDNKIKALMNLAQIDEKQLGPIYQEVLEVSGDEDWKDLYSESHKKEINRDMFLRLKLQNMNELRKQDAERIKKLEA